MAKTALVGTLMWLAAAAAWADDLAGERLHNWHQWRGPLATGEAPLGNPPTEWSETKNIKWKVPIPGRGSSTPIIWGDRIYLLTAIRTDRQADSATTDASSSPFRQVALTEEVAQAPADQPPGAGERPREGRGRGEGRGRRGGGRGFGFGGGPPPSHYHQFVVLCLNRHTGETIWQDVATEVVPHEGHHQTGSFAAASPITDGNHLYVSFGSRGIYRYDLDGNRQWKTELGQMQTRNGFGEGTSPALHGDTLIINWDHEGPSFIVALDADTGETKWKRDRDEVTSWNTPLVVEHNGRTQVVVNGTTRARGYDLETGDVLWECGGQMTNAIPSTVALDGVAYCMTGFRGFALYAIPLASSGDITGSDQVAWQLNDGTPYVSSPLLYNGRLYFTKDRNQIMSSVDAKKGQVIIDQKRLPGMSTIYASPVAAAGRIYFSSREGVTVVLKEGDTFEVLATNELDETIDASPAIIGDTMYIRGENSLYAIAE